MLCGYDDQLNRQQGSNNNSNSNSNIINTPAHQAPMSWYAAGYHQGAQVYPPANSYCMHQEEQNMWPHPHPHSHPHPHPHHHHHHHHVAQPQPVVFSNEYADFLGHNNYMPIQPPPVHSLPVGVENQIPSPPTGSEMSSSSTGGNISPPAALNTRPTPARSPFDWMKKPSYQTQPNPGKTRTKDKYRVVYTDMQRVELEREFHFHNKYITIRRKSELAVHLGLSERQIKIWFQNRRAKERKQLKKTVEEKTRNLNTMNNNREIPSFQGMVNQHMMQPGHVMANMPAMPTEQLIQTSAPTHPIAHSN